MKKPIFQILTLGWAYGVVITLKELFWALHLGSVGYALKATLWVGFWVSIMTVSTWLPRVVSCLEKRKSKKTDQAMDRGVHSLLVGSRQHVRPMTQEELDRAQEVGRALQVGGRVFIDEIHPPYREFGVIFEKHTYCAVIRMDSGKYIRYPYEFLHEDL